MIEVKQLGFSEALRAAWLLERHRGYPLDYRIARSNGENLQHTRTGYTIEIIDKRNGKLRSADFTLAPPVSCYWLETNDWTLIVS